MLVFAPIARGLPVGTWSQAAEAVESTSNDTPEGTTNGIANGKRSQCIRVGGGDHRPAQLTEDGAAAQTRLRPAKMQGRGLHSPGGRGSVSPVGRPRPRNDLPACAAVAAVTDGVMTHAGGRRGLALKRACPPRLGKVAAWRGRVAQQPLAAQVFFNVRLVDPVAAAAHSPVQPLLRRGVEQARIPDRRDCDRAPMHQVHAQGASGRWTSLTCSPGLMPVSGIPLLQWFLLMLSQLAFYLAVVHPDRTPDCAQASPQSSSSTRLSSCASDGR